MGWKLYSTGRVASQQLLLLKSRETAYRRLDARTMADAVALRLQMAQVSLKGSLGQLLLRVERAAVASTLRNPIQEVPQFPLIRVHRVASFAAQRYNELFKKRARGFHF